MPASRWLVSAGPRTFLARSCLDCGEFLPARSFAVNTKGYTDTTCTACRMRVARSRPAYRETDNAGRMRRYRNAQQNTQDRAAKSGQEWTMPELEILERAELTSEECARMLGRTYSAVVGRRHMMRDPAWATQ